jgi:hypothetical protein
MRHMLAELLRGGSSSDRAPKAVSAVTAGSLPSTTLAAFAPAAGIL